MKKTFHLIAMLAFVAVLGFTSCNKKQTYTVTFNANGGTGTMAAQTFEEGQTQALTANAFTKEGYEFVNWNTVADGSGSTYADKQSISINDNMNLYAQWKIIAAPSTEELLKGQWTITEMRENGIKIPLATGKTWNFKDNGKFQGWLDEEYNSIHCDYTYNNDIVTIKGGELEDIEDGEYYGEIVYRLYVDEITETSLELSGQIIELDEEGYESVEANLKVTLEK